jgi:hypothetical protein
MDMTMNEVSAVPKPTVLDQIGALITRLDPLIAYIAEVEKRRERVDKEILETLKSIATAIGAFAPPEVVKPELAPVTRVVTVPTEPIDVRVTPTPLQVTFRPRNRNYISEENTVAKDKPRELNVRVDLGRDGEYGYVVSDRGTIAVRINGGEQIKLFKGQVIYFHELNLLVSKLDLKTDSTTPVPYRLLVV